MEIDNPNIRYKVCFTCGKYMAVHLCNHISEEGLRSFERIHSGHMLQIVNYNEILKDFTRELTEKEREKTLVQIQEMLKV
jgi:hypothetical protein